jgi:uncharacterized protein YbjT (DUF2867 family)
MIVSIVGGHGQIALALTGLLAADGVEVRSLVRNPDHAGDVREVGGLPVIVDFESASDGEIDEAVAGSDVVVFAAGAGPGSSAERKETVDYGAAVRLIEAARRNGSPRYVMISAVRADPDFPGDEVFAIYQRAKGRADAELSASGLDHLILRPVRLTDEPPTGRVALARDTDDLESEYVPRTDVAAVLAETITNHPEANGTWNLSSGGTPIPETLP